MDVLQSAGQSEEFESILIEEGALLAITRLITTGDEPIVAEAAQLLAMLVSVDGTRL